MPAFEFRPYQKEAIRRALEHPGFAIFAEQRTGKTPIALAVVAARQPDRVLIACPSIAIETTWKTEIARSGLSDIEFRIVTYESLWNHRKALRKWGPQFIIADESHRIKRHMAKQSRGLRFVGRRCQWRLALSGTPIAQGIQDAWAQFNFVDPDLFGLWSSFKEHYLIYGGFRGRKIISHRNVEEFQTKLESLSYRVNLDDVTEVPTKITVRCLKFNLRESRPLYEDMERKFIAQLSEGKKIIAPVAVARAMKLHQITGGFLIDDQGKTHTFGTEKLERVGLLMLRLKKPLVIFVRFLCELERIEHLARRLSLSTTLVSGANKFEKFDTDIAIVQVHSGLSIDLSRAQSAIFFSMNYSHLDHDQARFRIRSFTSREVNYYYLIACDTIDEVIYATIESKASFASKVFQIYRRRAYGSQKEVYGQESKSENK